MAPTPTDKPTPQASSTNQLGALPFGSLIGGPLNAAIEAQAQAALSSVDFIQKVGLTEDGAVQNVKFKYVDSTSKDVTLEVPLLTIVPVPFIRIDDMTIDFKANISAATEVEDNRIVTSVESLLAQRGVTCRSCGLELTIETAASQPALDALKNLQQGLAGARGFQEDRVPEAQHRPSSERRGRES